MSRPGVSAVMAVYNGERFVEAALASMRGQPTPPAELIVIDDGSTDRTAELVKAIPDVVYVHQDNAGQAAALNTGIALASRDLVAFNDADDLWSADKLALQCAVLEADPDLDAVFGHAEQFLEPDAPAVVAAALTEARRVIPSYLHTAMLIRRGALQRIGSFDPAMRIGAIVDWYHRAMHAGLRSRMLPDVVLRRRLHGNNIGWQQKAGARQAYLDVVRAAMSRRGGRAS